jgi:hypothetical protein
VTTQRVDDATTLELVRLVDRLQRENMQLAGLVGSLQERNANLEAQLDLPAPVTSTVPESAPQSPSANDAAETTQKNQPRRRKPAPGTPSGARSASRWYSHMARRLTA